MDAYTHLSSTWRIQLRCLCHAVAVVINEKQEEIKIVSNKHFIEDILFDFQSCFDNEL